MYLLIKIDTKLDLKWFEMIWISIEWMLNLGVKKGLLFLYVLWGNLIKLVIVNRYKSIKKKGKREKLKQLKEKYFYKDRAYLYLISLFYN